jgi:hypothetical protein
MGVITIARYQTLFSGSLSGGRLVPGFSFGPQWSVALEIVFKDGLLIWALDELFRGVNPWRRCLGAAVLGYELTTIL